VFVALPDNLGHFDAACGSKPTKLHASKPAPMPMPMPEAAPERVSRDLRRLGVASWLGDPCGVGRVEGVAVTRRPR
jgi:hypothetical protein